MTYKTYRFVVDDILNTGELYVEAQITDKTVRLRLVKDTLRFSQDLLNKLLGNGRTVSIPKDGKSPHAIFVWEDNDFTIYPYRAGLPYWFTSMQDGGMHNANAT